MKIKIRVSNPVGGQLTYMPLRAAQRYVARGRARWQNPRTICFIEDSPDRRSAEKSAAALGTQLAYDRIGRMTLEQIEGIPVIGDPVKLFTLRS